WEDLRLFLAVAETGSLSAAARQLRVGQPTVSRRLAELEEELGYALFRRSAGGAVPTTEGERLLVPAKKMAEWAGEATRTAARGQSAPEGVVRIAAAPGVAFDFLAPFAGWLKGRHPRIRIELLTSVHLLDLARGEADLALRNRAPTSQDLKVVATLHHDVAAFASKDYAARLPRRYGLADVDWVAWAPPYENVPPNPQLEALIPNFRPSFTSDNFLVLFRAVECGLGATVLGKQRHRFSRPTPLVPLELDLGPHQRSAMHLVCAKSALDIPRVRLVAELLQEELHKFST
ncbi:MAG: LysR family transcriptional regulator, partial [Myxococcaceae bacterium]|nr:LysR family transcriptional regulator [Myxococcaceae bacterium]